MKLYEINFLVLQLYTKYSECIMKETTTLQIEKKTLKLLKEIKDFPRQTYNELISKMAEMYKQFKSNNQYDEFLHKIQQIKMKELWDNKEDEEWENA